MDNNFHITTCRLHTKQKNKLLIIGWFENDFAGKNHLKAYMDKKELSLHMEEKECNNPNLKSKTGKSITKNYFCWIDLTKEWRNGKEILIVNICADEKKNAGKFMVERLKKTEYKVCKYIDSCTANQKSFEISGWYINNGEAKIQFFDMTGKEYPVEIERIKRADVEYIFPENSEEEVIGFTASYEGEPPKKIRVHFEEGNKKSDYSLNLIDSAISKKFKKINKIRMYYKQYGIKATVKKVKSKLLRQEALTYKNWYRANAPAKEALEAQRKERFAYAPKISIVIPLYRTPKKYLDELIQSIQNQTYRNWELCLSDGSGDKTYLFSILKKYEEKDKRIKVVYNKKPLRISENTNEALKISTGDFIAFADHDDLLAPNALYECVKLLNEDKTTEIIYTDEDKVDMRGREHFMPHFKPDFNIDMLRSANYICHLFVVKRSIFENVGFLNPEFDGAQDYDFILRCIEKTTHIRHISKILYHWRAHKDSTAENPESKNYAFEAGKRAVQAHYDRVGIQAVVEETEYKGLYRTRYILESNPLISIVIPNKDHTDDLEKCISSIEKKSRYKNYEFIIVENNSTEESTFAYYKELESKCPRAKVVYWNENGFNYPKINNFGVEYAKGEYILFLNNDTEIINEGCLEELLGYCMRDDVGAVGARLYYEDGTIQHAGVIVGLGGVAGHAFVGFPHNDVGYFRRIVTAQNYSAVTAACVMIKKSVFEEVGGFEPSLAVAFNDIDLCMKIRKAGYLIVYNPYAELNHYESKSRGYEDTPKKRKRFISEIKLFQERWKEFLEEGDPNYSPNLTLDRNDFGLRENR